ncbi:uncharacterized protein [Watersipora subatra]|uniref:uncharacterized protein n=1 Tax=Watersipora subatra TaxID=2589382 RepID=UPI00355BBE31
MLPNYFYAEPRLDMLPKAKQPQPLSKNPIPQDSKELAVGLFFMYLFPKRPAIFGKRWPLVLSYFFLGVYVHRIRNRPTSLKHLQEDKIAAEYMQAHPDRFPVYNPKKLVDTFDAWYPKRNGGTGFMSEFIQIGRKKPTDHYQPINNEQ